jgi:hypothetical protein
MFSSVIVATTSPASRTNDPSTNGASWHHSRVDGSFAKVAMVDVWAFLGWAFLGIDCTDYGEYD